MNFYKHYIGDFQRDTGHLSLTQRGAYLALIHHYYATEKPLPKDIDALCRIAGATTSSERSAVKSVIGYFEEVDSGLMHSRIEAELEKAGKISNTNREIALAREAQRRAERESRTEHEQSTNRAENVPRTEHEQSTNQTPDTRHQTPDLKPTPESARVSVPDGLAGSVCKALMQDGIQGCNPHNPTLLALLEAGATIDEFRFAAPAAKGKAKPFNYLVSTVKRQREDAAKLVLHQGRLPSRINGNNVQEARLEVARQIMGGTNGTHGKIIDVTPSGSDSSDRARLPEAVDGVWEPVDGQVARH